MNPALETEGVFNDSWNRELRRARFIAVDAALQELKRCRERITPALGRSCAAFVECRGWKMFGAARLSDHATERYGRSSRWVRDLAAIGRGIAVLPGFEQAVIGGDAGAGDAPLGRTTAARLARVATPDSYNAWLALARRSDARQFAEAVRNARAANSSTPLADSSAGACSKAGSCSDAHTGSYGCPGAGARDGAGLGTAESGAADGTTHVSSLFEGGVDPDDPEARSEVGVFVPCSLRVGFDDVLELHRAVSGGQVPVWDFVEALVAEAQSGAVPADVDRFELRPGEQRVDVERRLADAAGGWRWLSGAAEDPAGSRIRRRSKADRDLDATFVRLLTDARRTCDRLHAITGCAGEGDAAELNKQIRKLLELDDAIERPIGELLAWIRRHRACAENLFNGIGHYAEERLGMNAREAQARSSIDGRLARFPLLREAYERGDLNIEAASIVARILGPGPVDHKLQAAWLKHALQVSIKRLRDEARVADRAWFDTLDPRTPEPLSDEAWFRSLALFPGTTHKRLERLVEGARPGHRRAAHGTSLMLRLPADLADRFLGAIEDRRLRCGDGLGLSTAPSATRLAKMFSGLGQAAPAWVGLLALLEEYVHTWDVAEALPRRRFAAIYARQGWRCAAPGCTSRCRLDAHHLVYRSHGGSDDPSNLIALCWFHHKQGEHGFLASCSGTAPLNIDWSLGHVSVRQWFRNERALSAVMPVAEAAREHGDAA